MYGLAAPRRPDGRSLYSPPVNAEFNWWLLIVGVVAGAALTWLVVADSSRREREVTDRELPAEATWIARSLGHPPVDPETAERVLRAHRRYLGYPPPDLLLAPEAIRLSRRTLREWLYPRCNTVRRPAARPPATTLPSSRALSSRCIGLAIADSATGPFASVTRPLVRHSAVIRQASTALGR